MMADNRTLEIVLTDETTGLVATILITELGDGSLQFDISLSDGATLGDLRGIFFDIADPSLLGGLTASGTDVGNTQYGDDAVSNLGHGANINGEVVNELGKFDGGIELGSAGIGEDDLQTTTFILSHDTEDLTLDMFEGQDFGLRLTSVGTEDGDRNGSLKLGGTAPMLPDDPAPDIEDVQFSIDENAYVGAVVGTVEDLVGAPNTTFSIIGGNELGAFAIDPNTGVISVLQRELLDYESGVTTFNLVVQASNGTGGTDTATVQVDINDREVVVIDGTEAADSIIVLVGAQEGVLQVRINGVEHLIANAEQLVINGLGGDDQLGAAGDFTRSFLDDIGFIINGGAGNESSMFYNPSNPLSAEDFVPSAILDGGEGNDRPSFNGLASSGIALGGNGNDTLGFQYPDGDEFADGGAGKDLLLLSWSSDSVGRSIDASDITDLSVGGNVVLNGDFANPIAVNMETLQVLAGSGNDTLIGGADRDFLNATTGVDTVLGGGGNDEITLWDINVGDYVDGGDGSDFFNYFGDSINEIMDGSVVGQFTYNGVTIPLLNVERLNLTAGDGDDTLIGSDGNDVLSTRGGGTDVLRGGAGNDGINVNLEDISVGDVFDGGTNTVGDRLVLGQFSFSNANGDDIVDLTSSGQVTVNGVSATAVNFEFINVFTHGGNDTILGGAENNFFNGGAGNDTYNTGGGTQDRIFDTSGDELFIFEDGTGKDDITGFHAGAGTDDVLDVSAFGFSAFDDGTLNDVESAVTDAGSYAIIQLDADDQVLLWNVSKADLHADDFII